MPETKPRRTESEAVRRAQLLKAARKVFRAKGYDSASVAEIVREAGVAQGTFYIYFPSKRDAAVALGNGLMETMAEEVAASVDSATSFEEQLEAVVAVTFRVARQNADVLRLAFIGADETHPELHSESPEHASVLRTIVDLFRSAVDAGEMEAMDPTIAARLVIGLLQHTVLEAFVFEDGREADALEQGVCLLLRNALKRRSE